MKILIAGCSKIAKKHINNIGKENTLYFYSRDTSKAHYYNKKYHGKGVFDDYQQALVTDIDCVIICTTPDTHAIFVIHALRENKAVLCEKPLCINSNELATIESVMNETGNKQLMVAENYLYKPCYMRIKKCLMNHLIGDLQRVVVQKRYFNPAQGWRKHYGALIEGGVHFIALTHGFLDEDLVISELKKVDVGNLDREVEVKLSAQSGLEVLFRYSWIKPARLKGVFQHCSLQGSTGMIVFECNGLYWFIKKRFFAQFKIARLSDLMGYKAMMKDFLSNASKQEHHFYSGFKNAKKSLELIFKIQSYKN